MNKGIVVFGILILMEALAGSIYAYTNLPSGSVITLDEDTVGAISFDHGIGSGTVRGSGDLSSSGYFGIDASSVAIGSYTGSISVVNDNSTSTNFISRSTAYGIRGSVEDNLFSDLTVSAKAGISNTKEFYAIADAEAYGVSGDVGGNLKGNMKVTALGGKATSEQWGASANAITFGVLGDVGGSLMGDMSLSAISGVATSRQSYAEANAKAFGVGVGGTISGDLSNEMTVMTVAGSAVSYSDNAEANATAVAVGDLNGNLSGIIKVEAKAGDASGETTSSAEARAFGAGIVSKDVKGYVSAIACGGSAHSSSRSTATANAIGIVEVGGTLSGQVVVQATGGTASSTSAEAFANALANGVLPGDILEMGKNALIDVSASGGTASVTGDHAADASAFAGGLAGNVNQDLRGTVNVFSKGGTATVTGNEDADASALSVGLAGDVLQNLQGTVHVSAEGWKATVNGAGIADASASASGLSVGGVNQDLQGTVNISARGGRATVTESGLADASAFAYGLDGGVNQNLKGTVHVYANGGAASSSDKADAFAIAYGLNGGVGGSEISGIVNVSAVGGSANGTASDASAFAYGIRGDSMKITNFTGNITATAIGGSQNGVASAGQAMAVGIQATTDLTLNIRSGGIRAVASGSNSVAWAILAGTGVDTITLGNATIQGDIDLAGGSNLLTVNGDTTLGGDIRSAGGVIAFEVDNGTLRFSKPVRVSDLDASGLTFSGDSRMFTDIMIDPTHPDNLSLHVDGDIAAQDPVKLNVYPAEVVTGSDSMFNKSYAVIDSTTGITGTFEEGSLSLFTLAIAVSNNAVWVTPTGLHLQEGVNAPSSASVTKALAQIANASLEDISSHIGSVRTLLRKEEVNTSWGSQPEGAKGPVGRENMPLKKKMEKGDVVGYVLQVNHMGNQGSSGAIAGYDWSATGFMVGAEKLINQSLLLGGCAGGVWSDTDGEKGTQGGASDLAVGSLYGDWIADAWHVELGFSYGESDSKTKRVDTTGRHYNGDFDSSFFGSWIEGGYTFFKQNYEIEPYGRTVYLSGDHDGFVDNGGGAPLTVAANTTANWTTELGVRGRRWWELENGQVFWLTLKGGMRSELLDTKVTSSGSIAGVPQYWASAESDPNALVLGVKASWVAEKRAVLSINYEPVISGNWFYHSINADVSYRF